MQTSGIFKRQLESEVIFRWLAFSVIALIVIWTYWPTLFHPPRADQVVYIGEVAHKHNPLELIFGCYDLNRNRVFESGDEMLFRPLLYAILGAEQVIFGYKFWAWQLFGICSHLMVLWVLLRLLWNLAGGWLALAATWLFALSYNNYEMVSWSHLSSYLLMIGLVLLALEQVIMCLEEEDLSWKRVTRMLLYLTPACFIYETANIFSLLIMAFLCFSFKLRSRVCLLALPVFLYGILSLFNYFYVNHLTWTMNSSGNLLNSVWTIVKVSSWWLYEGTFNSMYTYMAAVRTMFLSSETLIFKNVNLHHPEIIAQVIIAVGLGIVAWLRRGPALKKSGFAGLLILMALSYTAVIVMGRQDSIAIFDAVRINSYYLYIFWLLVVVTVFILIPKSSSSGFQRILVTIIVMASLLSGYWQAKRINILAERYAKGLDQVVLLARTLDMLVKEKGREEDFSFYVHPKYPGNYDFGLLRKKTEPFVRKYTFTEILYPQYFRPLEVAKYKLLVKGNH